MKQLPQVPRAILAKVYEAAMSSFPEECCGWLAGPKGSDEISLLRECENTEAPENRRRAFALGPTDLFALNKSFESRTPAKVFYHSHPNGRAFLSQVDIEAAISPWGDSPTYPLAQLVIAVDKTGIKETAMFSWDESEKAFVEIPAE